MVNLRTKRALKRAKHKTPSEMLKAGSKKKGRKYNKPAKKRSAKQRRIR